MKDAIYLDDDFRMIKSDSRNVILEQKVNVKKDGEIVESWQFRGYYSSLKNVLNGYLNKSLMATNAESINELLREIERLEQVINQKAEEVGTKMSEYMTTKQEEI